MTHFPLFLDLKDKNILIFGGGAFALQRVKKLLPFLAKITVISEHIIDEIKEIKEIKCLERGFINNDLCGSIAFVIIAENEELTERIYNECQNRNIHVNSVDMPKYCDIIFPSVIATDHLCIGISSGGISPTATVEFKEKFEEIIPDNIDDILEWMPKAKEYVKNNCDKKVHTRVLREMFKLSLSKERILSDNEIHDIITEHT